MAYMQENGGQKAYSSVNIPARFGFFRKEGGFLPLERVVPRPLFQVFVGVRETDKKRGCFHATIRIDGETA